MPVERITEERTGPKDSRQWHIGLHVNNTKVTRTRIFHNSWLTNCLGLMAVLRLHP